MTVNDSLQLATGFFVLLSLWLRHVYNPYWHRFTAFVSRNLFHSAMPNLWPAQTILQKKDVTQVEGVARAA